MKLTHFFVYQVNVAERDEKKEAQFIFGTPVPFRIYSCRFSDTNAILTCRKSVFSVGDFVQ
jgi:hypothetical protein